MNLILNKLKSFPLKIKVSAGIGTVTVFLGGIGFSLLSYSRSQEGFKLPVDLGINAYGFRGCYPSTYDTPQLIRQVQVGDVTYYEIVATSRDPRAKSISTLHIRTEREACAWLNRAQPTKRLSYMPNDVAVSFAEAHYRPMFERCLNAARSFKIQNSEIYCRQDMEKGLSGLPKKQQIFYPEEIAALKLLGINPSKIQNYQVEK
jgi:hypothetical protein